MKEEIMLGIGTGGALMTEFLFGGFTMEVKYLLALMAMDILFGMAGAMLGKSGKSVHGGLSSYAMWKGIVKKLETLGICAVAHFLDQILGLNYVMNACMYAFMSQEVLSMLETYTVTAGNPPEILKKVIDIAWKKGDIQL